MISVVICSVDDTKFRAIHGMYSRLLDGQPFEIIRISDARGLSEGYNRGFSLSRGQLVIFSHDDIEVCCDDFSTRLLSHMDKCDLLGVAGTDRLCNGNWGSSGPPHLFGQVIHSRVDPDAFRVVIFSAPARLVGGMQALDGIFICCRRDLVEKIGFDQQTFTGYHMYDLDFTFRAYLAGCRLAVACDLDVVHAGENVLGEIWEREEARFREKHAASLAPPQKKWFQICIVRVATLQDALTVVRPAHFA